jgi:hypothetical protein
MSKKTFFLSAFFLFLFVNNSVFSDDNLDSIFIVNSFTFNVDGLSRPFALIQKADLITGVELKGESALEKYIRDKHQLLMNERVLDNVKIEYTIGDADEDNKYPVDFIINVKDTWNIVAIPRPQYSSNSGFDITVKARDYNFLGTMSPLRFDIGYQRDQHGQEFYSLMLDSDIPFRAFGLIWNLNFDHDYTYRADLSQHHYYKNVTGLSVDLPFFFTTPKIGFDVAFIVNEEFDDIEKILYGDFQEGLYISFCPFISWRIPIYKDDSLGDLVYTPRIMGTFNQEISPWILKDIRKGPFVDFSHSLVFGRINWLGNFQQGYTTSINNSFNYDFYKYEIETEPLKSNVSFSAAAHFVFFDFFGFSSRLMYRQWFNTYNDKAANALRGILDKDISTDFMISLNIDVPVRVLRIRPSQWFDDFTRLFDFDLHLSPVVDFALYRNMEKDEIFTKDNFLVSGGMEMIIFPDFFRSLYLRISIAWDFSNISKRTPMELFIGTDLHY